MGYLKVENGILVLDRDEIRGIPEFHKILVRDKGSDGDSQGRNKAFAFKEFMYIWYRTDLESPGNKQGMDAVTLHTAAKKEARLPEDWKPDAAVIACIEKCKEEQFPELVLLNATLRGINVVSRTMSRLSDSVETIYAVYQKAIEDKTGKNEPINLAEDLANLQAINSHCEEIFKIASKVPKLLLAVEEQRDSAMKKKAGKKTIRGDHQKGNRADPN